MRLLSEATVSRLPPEVSRPRYDRNSLKCGVVHIGVGAFHRAHQAPLFDSLANDGDLRWGIVGASLRSPAVRDALRPQDYLYTLTVEDGLERCTKVVGAVRDVIVATEHSENVAEAIASPDVKLVTVTVSEKGYRLDRASGLLLESDPGIQRDLVSLNSPVTLPGVLAAGLKRRKDRMLCPLTIMSCDNLEANGRKLQSSVIELARAHDSALSGWIGEQCLFPNTMVDRIVPASTDSNIITSASEPAIVDRAPVRTEPFSQWVIEDRFSGPRPELERHGVRFTSDIAPWERAKLRMLNGAHSTMAYLGGLAGISTVDSMVTQSWGRHLVEMLWDEVQATLRRYTEIDLAGYREQLMDRFANSALNHRLAQIANDGSQKLPQRLVAPAVELLDMGHLPRMTGLSIAAWIRCQHGVNDLGEQLIVDDPLSSTMKRLLESASSARDRVSTILSLDSIFPERLTGDRAFHDVVTGHLESLERLGARATVQKLSGNWERSVQSELGR